jgi:hypothetical protein
VNAVFFRIKSLLGEFKSDGIDKRFYKELGNMLTKTSTTTTTTEQRKELKPDVAVACVLSGMNPMFTATAPTGGEKNQNGVVSLPPFMQMALAGRVEVVRTLFLMDPDAAEEQDSASRTTLERLLCIPAAERTAEQSQIIEMLKEVKKQ